METWRKVFLSYIVNPCYSTFLLLLFILWSLEHQSVAHNLAFDDLKDYLTDSVCVHALATSDL